MSNIPISGVTLVPAHLITKRVSITHVRLLVIEAKTAKYPRLSLL